MMLFAIIWLHVSVLNLFYVNHQGPVFLWEENMGPRTLAVHFIIALITTATFLIGQKVHQHYRAGGYSIRESILIFASCCMVLSIGFLLTN